MRVMNTQTRKEILADNRAAKLVETIKWVSERFGIPASEIIGYNSGSAYDKVWVKTRATAEKVAAKVKGDTCNGGMFHGMALGGISSYDGIFEVMC